MLKAPEAADDGHREVHILRDPRWPGERQFRPSRPIPCEGINFWLADGEAAFQDVFHTHLHVIPRLAGDSFEISFELGNPNRLGLDEIAGSIAARL